MMCSYAMLKTRPMRLLLASSERNMTLSCRNCNSRSTHCETGWTSLNATSQRDPPDEAAKQPAHLEQVVHKLADFTQQQHNKYDSSAKQQKQKNAVLCNFVKPAADSLQDQVEDLFCKVMGISVTCASATRIGQKADAAHRLVVVQFKTKEDKKAVIQARGNLRGKPGYG